MRLPDDSNRHAIFGMTGSGKTHNGLWALQKRSYHLMPWIIFDFKRDKMIGEIPRLEEVSVQDNPPRQAGLYVVRPNPGEEEVVDEYLWKIWRRGRIGIYIDEGYMIDRFSKPLRAILTQGRSLRIPVISLSQRPSWICPFLMSESEYLQAFYMHNPADVKKMQEWMPIRAPIKGGEILPPHGSYMSYYYEVKTGKLSLVGAVPSEDEILGRYDDRVPRRYRMLKGLLQNSKRKKEIRVLPRP